MIENIESFFGFTENIKEPRKTRVEMDLMKLCRYEGKVFNRVTFLVIRLLEGCTPEKKENCQYYKKHGELSKPKTLYKCNFDSAFIEINKTEYDFMCYLIKNELITETAIIQYLAEEKIRNEAIVAQKIEEERIAMEREEVEKKEVKRVTEMLQNDLRNISDEEKAIASEIFFRIYGEKCDWNYSIIPLIHNFDIPFCKDQIKSRLHNNNKASIKIFERITGLKLPKGWKERIKYLDSITSADFNQALDFVNN